MHSSSVWRSRAVLVFACIFGLCSPSIVAGPLLRGYALILSDPPLARHRAAGESPAAIRSARAGIESAQASVRAVLVARGFEPVVSLKTLLNAVIVRATPEQLPTLRALPGVAGVIPLRQYKMNLNAAVNLINVPAAWNTVGGQGKAGEGVKIAIIDTGIDNHHAAFQDSSLAAPAGFPACLNTTQSEIATGYNCSDFTNNKVIVAKSFVQYLNDNDPTDSTPDDYSPRDRVGHGTAVAMCAAGETNTGNLGPGTPNLTITGVAPKAYLGSYKVFGSTGTNGFADDASILPALEEAEHDKMDVAVMSLGAPALVAPTETGAVCGLGPGQPCDAEAAAVENATKLGMTVVIAGGNLGDSGQITPTPGTISSPGDAASVITVGAIENSHQFSSELTVPNYGTLLDNRGDGPVPAGPITASLVDAAKAGSDQYACTTLAPNSMKNAFGLIERGPADNPCTFATKVQNAQKAGAIGVVFYDDQNETPIIPSGLTNTSIPSVIISNSDGLGLKAYVDSHPGAPATIDPSIREAPNPQEGQVIAFSSRGPVLGAAAGLKPDVLAVGDNVFMAAQSYDPNGELYSPTGYTVAGGTSFATPMVGGAAALIIGNALNHGQTAPNPAEVKSRIVNTANPNVTDITGNAAAVTTKGGGIMNANAALTTDVTINPATLSFGSLSAAGLPQTLIVTNHGASAANLQFTVINDPNATTASNQVSVNPPSITVPAGGVQSVVVSLSGGVPASGIYAGQINVAGANQPLHVPFIFGAPSKTAHYVVNISGDFDATQNQTMQCCFAAQFLDQSGFPVPNYSVKWQVTSGDAQLLDNNNNPAGQSVTMSTDQNGIVYIDAKLGAGAADKVTVTSASDSSLSVAFNVSARPQPTVAKFQDSASFTTGRAVSPGSYLTLYGTGLSDVTAPADALPLPLNIANANVSFDLINAACAPFQYSNAAHQNRCSFPGRISYASGGQVNVLVPWELTQGIQNLIKNGRTPGCDGVGSHGICAQVKVWIDQSYGGVVYIPLALYDPGFFMDANGFVAARDAQNGALVSQNNAAKEGEFVALYCNGLGPVDTAVASGDAPPSNTFVRTTTRPVITIAGKQVPDANIEFSGLAPNYAGLYQVNVKIPNDPSLVGKQQITIAIGGVTSPAASIQ